MSKILQVRLDEQTKTDVDNLFDSLGLDTSTAVRIFFKAVLEYGGIPFPVKRYVPNPEMLEAIDDVRNRRNLHGPYNTAKEAIAAMLED